jgi:hypothetical protein
MSINLYIDPGSGSLLIQALIAGVISLVMFFKNIKNYVSTFLYVIFNKFRRKND